MDEWRTKSAAEIGRGIAAGVVCPLALTESYLAAIEAHPLADRIYARLTPERARAEAAAARDRAQSGARRSPLDGVPISWKDLFDTAGVATEAGSKLLEGRIPERDAEVLRTATAAGLVCLGKTHMSELAFSGLGLNPSTATSPCVNDEAAVSGGSSSGAAASVAFGLAAAAIGSDTGGSVRVPAAWNDLVGLKTTAGRVSLNGTVPLAAKFDTVGPLCRTVEDAALLLAVLEGRPAPDLRGARAPGLRFARLRSLVEDDLEEAPRRAYEAALERLSAAGATIEDIDLPLVPHAQDLASILYTSEAYGLSKEMIEAAPEKMFPEILTRFRIGREHSAADYIAAWRDLEAMRAEWAAEVARFDAVLCPTVPILPPKKTRLETEEAYYKSANLLTLRNTRVGNLMGLAVLTLPTGAPSCGLSVMARAWDEDRLLRLGAAVETQVRG